MACAALAAEWGAKDGQGWYAATSSIITTTPSDSRRCLAFGRCSECGIPVSLGHLVHGLRREPLARGVDEQIEPAELVGRPLDERVRSFGVREVAVHAPCSDHRPAFGAQSFGNGGPHLSGPACDERAHVRGV
jgi:hypothetical protein